MNRILTTYTLLTILTLFTFNLMGQNEAGYIWTNVKMGGGGFVTGIITTPAQKDLIYARTDVGGAYRWNEATQGWIPLLDWNNINQTSYQGVEAIAIDPSAPNKVYMLVGTSYWNNGITAILRSDDYGDNFTIADVSGQFRAHGNGMGRQTGERLAVDPNKGSVLFCGTRIHGLFKSENAGATWSKVTSFPTTPTGNISDVNGISSVVFDPESGSETEPSQRIFAAISRTGQDNLYVSEDGGTTWEPLAGAISNLMVHRMEYAHGNLYLTYVNNTGPWNIGQSMGAVYKYNIEEKTWHNITPATNTPFAGISVDHQNPDIIMVSTINIWNSQNWITGNTQWGDRIYRSTNGGQTWANLFATNRFTLDVSNVWDTGMSMHWVGDIKIDPFNSDRVITISGNGIFMTRNIRAVETGKATWHLQVDGLEETVPLGIVSIPNGPTISVIGDYDGFTHANVYATNQRHRPSVGTSTGIDFAQNNNSFVVRSGGNESSAGIFYSTDQGKTWTAFATKPETLARSGQVAVSANGDKVIWKPDGVNNTYFTTNRGATWHPVASQAVTGRPVSDRVNNNIFYIYSASTLRIFTFNEGTNSYDVEQVNAQFSGRDIIQPVPHIEGEVWIAQNTSGLRRYSHSGKTLVKIQAVAACRAVGFGKAPSGKIFPAVFIWGTVNGVEGIFRSDDEGDTWLRINDDKHQYGGPGNAHFVTGDANVFGRVYMSTVGRGIVMGYPEGETSVIEPTIRRERQIEQGRVFSGSLSISSASPNAAYKIFDLSGKVIEQGFFSGQKQIGSNLGQGMYILSIFSEEGHQVSRILKKD